MTTDWRSVEVNLRGAMRLFSRATERGEAREMPGVALVSSGVDYSVFNSAMLTSPVAGAESELDRRAAIAAVHFSMRRIGWSFWLCEELLDVALRRRAEAILAARGLRRTAGAPGMLAEKLLPPARPLPEIDCRRVDDAQTRSDFCHITSIGFHLPYPIAQAIYGSAGFWAAGYRGWVGYSGGLPVTTAATVAESGVIGLYSVSTLPECRRRGYGEAVARHALAEAAAGGGVRRYVLQSTSAGHHLYERMGYRTVANFTIYVA